MRKRRWCKRSWRLLLHSPAGNSINYVHQFCQLDGIDTPILRVLVAHGQIGTHRSAGRTEGELATADEVESANASLSVHESLPTAFRRLHHRRNRLRGSLCPLAPLSCSRKGTAAPSLLLQLAVQSGRTLSIPSQIGRAHV